MPATAPLNTPLVMMENLIAAGFVPGTANSALSTNATQLMTIATSAAATYPVVNNSAVNGGYLAGVNRTANQLIADITANASSSVIAADVKLLVTNTMQFVAGCLATDLVAEMASVGCPGPTAAITDFQNAYIAGGLTPAIPSASGAFDTATAAAAAAASGTPAGMACSPSLTPLPPTTPVTTAPTTPATTSSSNTAIVATVAVVAVSAIGLLAYKMSVAAKAAKPLTRR